MPIDFKSKLVIAGSFKKATANSLKLTAKVFPNAFSKAPTSSPSDLLTCIFCPSLYSPDGSNLLSRSLFILDFIKAFLTSAIQFNI